MRYTNRRLPLPYTIDYILLQRYTAVNMESRAQNRGVHREWEFTFPVFPMGIPWEWEWTMYNLGTGMGMGMGITMREWEEMGMSKCGKIPEPRDSHSSCRPTYQAIFAVKQIAVVKLTIKL